MPLPSFPSTLPSAFNSPLSPVQGSYPTPLAIEYTSTLSLLHSIDSLTTTLYHSLSDPFLQSSLSSFLQSKDDLVQRIKRRAQRTRTFLPLFPTSPSHKSSSVSLPPTLTSDPNSLEVDSPTLAGDGKQPPSLEREKVEGKGARGSVTVQAGGSTRGNGAQGRGSVTTGHKGRSQRERKGKEGEELKEGRQAQVGEERKEGAEGAQSPPLSLERKGKPQILRWNSSLNRTGGMGPKPGGGKRGKGEVKREKGGETARLREETEELAVKLEALTQQHLQLQEKQRAWEARKQAESAAALLQQVEVEAVLVTEKPLAEEGAVESKGVEGEGIVGGEGEKEAPVQVEVSPRPGALSPLPSARSRSLPPLPMCPSLPLLTPRVQPAPLSSRDVITQPSAPTDSTPETSQGKGLLLPSTPRLLITDGVEAPSTPPPAILSPLAVAPTPISPALSDVSPHLFTSPSPPVFSPHTPLLSLIRVTEIQVPVHTVPALQPMGPPPPATLLLRPSTAEVSMKAEVAEVTDPIPIPPTPPIAGRGGEEVLVSPPVPQGQGLEETPTKELVEETSSSEGEAGVEKKEAGETEGERERKETKSAEGEGQGQQSEAAAEVALAEVTEKREDQQAGEEQQVGSGGELEAAPAEVAETREEQQAGQEEQVEPGRALVEALQEGGAQVEEAGEIGGEQRGEVTGTGEMLGEG